MRYSGTSFLVAASLCLFLSQVSRGRLSQPAPAFLSAATPGVKLVEFGSGFCPEGVYQIIDGKLTESAKNLTSCLAADQGLFERLKNTPFQQGERLEIIQSNGQPVHLRRSWMAAAKRLSVGVRLHPDSMSYQDWLDIPGIGPVIAGKIEIDRQNNGDFECLNNLRRISGVGNQRIEKFKRFFTN